MAPAGKIPALRTSRRAVHSRRTTAPRAWLVSLALAVGGLLWARGAGFAASPGAGGSHQHRASHVARWAEADPDVQAGAEDRPTVILGNLVSKHLRQNRPKGDIVYKLIKGNGTNRWTAQVTLSCVDPAQTHTGSAQTSQTKAKTSAAEVALADSSLIQKLAPAEPPARKQKKVAKKASKKAAKKAPEGEQKAAGAKTLISELEVGQEVKGRVRGTSIGAIYIDVGANVDGYLAVSEVQDAGFPKEGGMRKGNRVTARVLAKNETYLWLTRLSGSLDRPEKVMLGNDGTAFEGIAPDTRLDAKVIGMTFKDALLAVTPPQGGEPVAGLLRTTDFAGNFAEEANIGSTVNVRVKAVQPDTKRLFLSMKEPGALSVNNVEPGQSVTGEVQGWLRGSAVFVDVGLERDGLLHVEEMQDGFPADARAIRRGDKIEARILSKDGDKVYLTRRTGSLDRTRVTSGSAESSDLEPLADVSQDTWLDAQVVRFVIPDRVVLKVQVPGSDQPVQGTLYLTEFGPTFQQEAISGLAIKVRVKKVDPAKKLLVLTMKSPAESASEPPKAEVAEETKAAPEAAPN